MADSPNAQRIIHQADAVAWLEEQGTVPGHSFVASLPDVSEFPKLTVDGWKEWFTRTAGLVLSRTPPDGVAIFYQRDTKHSTGWIDKGYLIQKAAEREGVPLVWHKVVCRATPGSATFGMPAWSHLLCFSREVRVPVAQSTPDVIVKAGESTWARGMGREVCELVAGFVLERTATRGIVNPFCGEGLLLAVANKMGLHAVGIERSRKRAEAAQLQSV